jgi:hypothetical protein
MTLLALQETVKAVWLIAKGFNSPAISAAPTGQPVTPDSRVRRHP